MTTEEQLRQQLCSALALSSELLDIFQQERTFCLAKGEFDLEVLKNFVARKERLTGEFDCCRSRIRELVASGIELDEEHRGSLRELGIVLEQLLIIDCENEKQLRELAAGVPVVPRRAADNGSSLEPQMIKEAEAPDLCVEPETPVNADMKVAAAASADDENDENDEFSRLVELLVGRV